MGKKAIVYHKPCLTCEFDDWHVVENWANDNGIKLKKRRTEYNPLWHQKATEIWGDEMYPPFITDGANYITVEYAIEKIKGERTNDLLDMFGTKKRARKSRMVVEKKKADNNVKEEA
jgi:hypothetical protein